MIRQSFRTFFLLSVNRSPTPFSPLFFWSSFFFRLPSMHFFFSRCRVTLLLLFKTVPRAPFHSFPSVSPFDVPRAALEKRRSLLTLKVYLSSFFFFVPFLIFFKLEGGSTSPPSPFIWLQVAFSLLMSSYLRRRF